MNTVTATARRRAREIAVLACLTGLALAGCGTYRAGATGRSGTAGHTGAAALAGIAEYAGTAGRTGQARTYAAMMTSTSPGRPVPASAVPRLKAIAERFAKLNGGHALTEATAVLTTHGKALTSATPGDFVPGSAGIPVYLVTMQGQFVAYGASRPAGAPTPTGRYASLVLNAHSFDGMDVGIGNNPPPVPPQSLGLVTDLLLQPAS
jgi:hypothetical protein